jgi:hypothetical protein
LHAHCLFLAARCLLSRSVHGDVAAHIAKRPSITDNPCSPRACFICFMCRIARAQNARLYQSIRWQTRGHFTSRGAFFFRTLIGCVDFPIISNARKHGLTQTRFFFNKSDWNFVYKNRFYFGGSAEHQLAFSWKQGSFVRRLENWMQIKAAHSICPSEREENCRRVGLITCECGVRWKWMGRVRTIGAFQSTPLASLFNIVR